MSDESNQSTPLESWDVPDSVKWTSPYLKRLLIERHQIRAKLENPGGSVIVGAVRKLETDQMTEYSSVIGNNFELDLIDAEAVISKMDAIQRRQLLEWCDGLPAVTAAEFASVKPGTVNRRGQRVAKKVVDRLNDDSTVRVRRVA